MVIYTQSTECSGITAPANQAECSAAENIPNDKICKFTDTNTPCQLVNKPAETPTTTSSKKSAKSSTNSSDILNIFKITLALLIVFTIL
jgi:hypothetical protein